MRLTLLALVFAGLGSAAGAQTPVTEDLTPTPQQQRYRICNDRPERPAWAEELHIREAWKGVTFRELYELRAWERIAETQDCSCEVRFPEWAAADEEYRERFSLLGQSEQTALRREFRSAQRLIEDQVRAICEAQGNW